MSDAPFATPLTPLKVNDASHSNSPNTSSARITRVTALRFGDLLGFCRNHYLKGSTTDEWKNAAIQHLRHNRSKIVAGMSIFEFASSRTCFCDPETFRSINVQEICELPQDGNNFAVYLCLVLSSKCTFSGNYGGS